MNPIPILFILGMAEIFFILWTAFEVLKLRGEGLGLQPVDIAGPRSNAAMRNNLYEAKRNLDEHV